MKTTIVAFPGRYDRQDWLIAVGIILLVFMFGLGYLTTGLPWGDDNAAYITEGIAIANGELAEQAQRNTILHPTELPLETDQNGLVYVWGLPLLLSLVYKLVGFDTVRYSSVIYYKAPPLICLALLGGVLYLFNRRHCSRRCAVFLSLMLCLSNHLLYNMDAIYVDTFFLFFAMLSLLLTEIFVQSLSKPDDCGPSIPLCLALGIVLWYTYETRLNGIAICIVSFCAAVFKIFCKRAKCDAQMISGA